MAVADTTTRTQIADPGKDIYWHGTVDQAEIARLDAMHNGIKNYLDGKIFLAPLDDPRTILDIGVHNGRDHRAIECAEYFPNAKVTAVDISPMLPRPVPSNFEFQHLNILADSLPWEAGSLDVVHVRFLLIHLPEPQRVLERIAKLWRVKGDASTVRTAFELVCKFWESNGQIPAVGSKLQSWLRQTGTFSQINVHEAPATFGTLVSPGTRGSPPPEHCSWGFLDPRLGGLGLTFKNSMRSAFSGKTHPGLLALGYTPEFKEQLLEEFDALEWQSDFLLFCVSARRSV
ncbi:hypothetical protein BJY52DRAFT_1247386 [Lactarius psammicola]|nr:hypothetical protein BJY52DRAFT_1247386 [Lactarius psammicola]